MLFSIVRAHKSAPKMHSSFPSTCTSPTSSLIFNPSVNSTQSPIEYLHVDEQGRSPQFSSSFSIRAILSSSSNSSPQTQPFPSYGHLLLTGDVGAFECSAPFPLIVTAVIREYAQSTGKQIKVRALKLS